MIIVNGTIELKDKTAGGIDPHTGHPIKPTAVAWGAPIPCQYIANQRNNLGRVGSEAFTIANYTILIEERAIEGEQLRLTDRSGKVLGEYSIISTETLSGVCQVRILV